MHFSPPVFSILWEQIHMGDMLSRVISGARASIFSTIYPGCCDFCVGNSCGCMLRIFWRSCRYCYDENLRYMSCFPWACICHGDCSYSWGRHSECCYSTGSSKLAEIFTYCQRADSGIKKRNLIFMLPYWQVTAQVRLCSDIFFQICWALFW